jgi:transcriptional regulator GlxA family with amidase domain
MKSIHGEPAGGQPARQAVVERAEAYVRAHLDTPISVACLCRLTGVSERGLRNAFYEVHGMSPKRWMVSERLIGVQTALRQPRSVATTVTSVATEHGFYQLGKFAAIYRKTFGEAPSRTLHAASSDRAHCTTPPEREKFDVCSR